MKKLILILALVFTAAAVPVIQTGCNQAPVSLESGGAYTDPVLATTDQAILDASHAMTGLLAWYDANATYLAKWPEIGATAAKVRAQKDGWIRDAYSARDAYFSAAAAFKAGKGSSPDPQRANLNAAMAVLTNLVQQFSAYQTAHPHA